MFLAEAITYSLVESRPTLGKAFIIGGNNINELFVNVPNAVNIIGKKNRNRQYLNKIGTNGSVLVWNGCSYECVEPEIIDGEMYCEIQYSPPRKVLVKELVADAYCDRMFVERGIGHRDGNVLNCAANNIIVFETYGEPEYINTNKSKSKKAYNEEFDRVRGDVLERDCYECQECGRKSWLEVHHKTKRSDGGSNEMDNLITLCIECHCAEHIDDAIYPNMLSRFEWLKKNRPE